MLELKNISFSVEEDGKQIDILKDVSLTVEDRKFVVITGPNGSGKSTLARIVAGIEKPTAGRIVFDGEDITDKTITERARMGISFAFQQPVRFKGLEVIDLLRLATGKTISVDAACDYLSEVGLCARDYIHREVNSSLSGGELKRIEIATVMARKARLTLFDEPEAGIVHRRRDRGAGERAHRKAGRGQGRPEGNHRHAVRGGALRENGTNVTGERSW